jgi:hypothetical protein
VLSTKTFKQVSSTLPASQYREEEEEEEEEEEKNTPHGKANKYSPLVRR